MYICYISETYVIYGFFSEGYPVSESMSYRVRLLNTSLCDSATNSFCHDEFLTILKINWNESVDSRFSSIAIFTTDFSGAFSSSVLRKNVLYIQISLVILYYKAELNLPSLYCAKCISLVVQMKNVSNNRGQIIPYTLAYIVIDYLQMCIGILIVLGINLNVKK